MEQDNKVYECRRLTTADIAKVFIAHVDKYKLVKSDRNDYFEFARAIEQEMLRQQADRIAELEKQTKPLSDEEIEDLAGYAGENPTKSDMIAFARAVEERHGIK